jgi:hypothetical protein
MTSSGIEPVIFRLLGALIRTNNRNYNSPQNYGLVLTTLLRVWEIAGCNLGS